MKSQAKLKNTLASVRVELEAGLAEAEAELAQLDERRAELTTLISQARAALGLNVPSPALSSPDRLTLHEALEHVLQERGNAWTSARELADEVNARGLYTKRDRRPVEVNQVHARVKNYTQLFEKEGSQIRLRDG
jgi:hypothetical protein